MRKYFLIILFYFCLNPFYSNGFDKNPILSKISFEENKGQIHDQNGKPRADVLFRGENEGFIYFFKKSGFVYQQNRVIDFKLEKQSDHSKEEKSLPNKVATHRIELNWIGANPNLNLKASKSRSDYNNYYMKSEITHVMSYEELYYKELYKGIDVKWYQSGGKLKYDYIVSKGANYKQIKLQILGYKSLFINRSGELVIETILGNITEQAPVVIQNGGKLNAKWVIENEYVSFEIDGIDPNYGFIIDPIVRDWGTYYGGNNSEFLSSGSSSMNNNGDLLFVGNTNSTNNIATTGAHQTTLTPTSTAFLVKFDTNGVRIWATYYGGDVGVGGDGCFVNASGEVFMVGNTTATSGVSTSGAHQTSNAGATDAIIVKFNSAGIRQWATYYGGTSSDAGHAITEDQSGNIFMTGNSSSLNGIATSGSFLDSFAGGTADAFLVKFNSAGVRQWATYYGGAGEDQSRSCRIDAFGNVCISGVTQSTNGISSPGAHQVIYGGGLSDNYLVNFTTGGIRLWGTYYGGNGSESVPQCDTDPFGNIFISGVTTSTNNIATAASHQPTFAGVYDAFVAKFNSSGVIQWATYYGGSQDDNRTNIRVSANGNVYCAGETKSPNNISTPNAFQLNIISIFSPDIFIVKFNNIGIREWGTYYGDSGSDDARNCEVDIHGKVYVMGRTTSATNMATTNSHQTSIGGSDDLYIAKFIDCPAMGLSASVSNSFICSGSPLSFTSFATTTMAINFNWAGPSSFTSNIQNPSIASASVTQSGTYSVTVKNNNSGCYETKTLSIIVNPIPTITVNSGSICAGQIFTMNPTGAGTYTYSNGSQTVSPTINSTYSVSGTSTAGCVSASAAICSVSVFPLPTVSITSTLSTFICNGDSTTLASNGAANYVWSTSATGTNISISPSVTTVYSVTGSDAIGCSNTALQTVSVYPIFNLSISANPSVICKGQTATLSVAGATSYAWSNGGSGPSISDSPTITTTYTINGTDINGCSNSTILTLTVTDCTSLDKIANINEGLMIYPNPTKGSLFINSSGNHSLQVFDLIGSLVISKEIIQGMSEIDLSLFGNGIYFIKINSSIFKVIKE